MHSAVGRCTRLRDDLIRILRAAGGDDALLEAQRRRLLEDQRELVHRRRHDDGLGIGALQLGKLCAHVLGALVHGLDGPDGDTLLLHHLAEVFSGAATPVIVDDEEIDLLQFELVDDPLERRGLDRRRRRDAEDVGIAGRGDLARRGGLDHHRRFVFHQLGHHGKRQARAPRPHQHRHLVAGDQLFGDGGGLGRIALVVLDDEFELLAENAALCVDLIGRDLGAVDDVGTGCGERTRKRFIDADLDGLSLGGTTQQGDRQRNRRNKSESPCHVVLQSHAVHLSAVQTSSFPHHAETSIHHVAPSSLDEKRPTQPATRARKRLKTSDIPFRSAATASAEDVPDSRRSRLSANSAINRAARSRTSPGLPTCASMPESVYPMERSTRVPCSIGTSR